MGDDRDDESICNLYENGYWTWDDNAGSLAFIRAQMKEETELVVSTTPNLLAEFRELDLIEQLRFRKRYQRKLKPGQEDVITLQDIKDLVIYTAPLSIMTSKLINLLHLPTTERFIRALIIYCQVYLQTANTMKIRMEELSKRIRTPTSIRKEKQFSEDLCDLRSLVAKEYSTIIVGGQDTKKFHHMGAKKAMKSLAYKDSCLIEGFFLICIQIVWIALGRRSFNKLELEINRILKTEIFNSVEHRLNTKHIETMCAEERTVLLGDCLRHETKLKTRSPLLNEIFCTRHIDYRMLGLGVIKYYERRDLPSVFPQASEKHHHLNDKQRKMWLLRLSKLSAGTH